ncbi:protein of unknown function [Streptomyces sp. KY75]|nr:protein of unknown function [Streptomyces sp. KY75]
MNTSTYELASIGSIFGAGYFQLLPVSRPRGPGSFAK